MREIAIVNRKFTVRVDDGDYAALSAYKWYAEDNGKGHVYARAFINKKCIKMHRLLMDVSDPKIKVDHIDHDGLNNQRANLRACTHSQNEMNRKRAYGSSKYIGVCLHKNSGLYHASVYVNKKYLHIGYFKDEVEAAKNRDSAAKEAYGEFAKLNFPT